MSTEGGPLFTFSLPGGGSPLAPRQLRHCVCVPACRGVLFRSPVTNILMRAMLNVRAGPFRPTSCMFSTPVLTGVNISQGHLALRYLC